jgi:hypothetical protein
MAQASLSALAPASLYLLHPCSRRPPVSPSPCALRAAAPIRPCIRGICESIHVIHAHRNRADLSGSIPSRNKIRTVQ